MRPLRFVLAVPHGANGQILPSIVATPGQVCSDVAALWCDSETPCHFLNRQCCLIGIAFSRTTYRRVRAAEELGLAPAEAEEAAKHLVANVWGGYVAILGDWSNGPMGVLVDPSGLLPVYLLSTSEHVILTSDPLLIAEAGGLETPVSYPALHAHLLRPEQRHRKTCLEGIDELAPGSLHLLARQGLQIRRIWHATDFLPRMPIPAFTDYATQLKELGAAVLQSWSGMFGRASVAASGGVDSSFICAALAHSGERFDCVTLATPDPSGDERIYANRVAEWFGVRCVERIYDPAFYDPSRSSSRGLPRPARRSFQHILDALLVDAMADLGASVIYDGNGGDNLFCFLHSSAPVADRLAAEGLGTGVLRSLIDMCHITGCSVPTMVAAVLRRRLGKGTRESWPVDASLLTCGTDAAYSEPLVPWLSPLGISGSGKRDHMVLIMRAQNHIHGLAAGPPRFSPLMSQPLMEFCLGVPTWIWTHGGRNRALARAAFAQELPPAVLARTSKAGPDSFVRQIFALNRNSIAERLLDGLLAANGVIDRHAVEAALRTDERDDNSMFGRILDLLEAENWARSWTR